MTAIIAVIAIALGVLGIRAAIKSPAPPPITEAETQKYCPNCGAIGVPQFRKSGSTFLEILLWLCGLLPGMIYSLWRASSKRFVCPKCEQVGMIPLDSPKARATLGTHN